METQITIIIAVIGALVSIGVSWIIGKSKASKEELELLSGRVVEQLQKDNTEILMMIVRVLKFRDRETDKHSERVTQIMLHMATKLELPQREVDCIYKGALLHDIGKIFVPDYILHKTGKLTPEELKIMQKHPQDAYDVLMPVKSLAKCLDIPYCHHERWNGSGYPRGLSGKQIPYSARLFAIIDVYDALISERPYRMAMTQTASMTYIQSQSGIQFDPELVVFFADTMKEWIGF
jgi:response regulator RpfG family c-di-GMP phosphodiesterase